MKFERKREYDMNYKSQKGMTMISLVIYIASFSIVAIVIGFVTRFFYSNTKLLNSEIYSAAEYNKLNMYLAKESEESGNSFVEFNDLSNMYKLEFSNGNVYTYDKDNNLLYCNKVCLCENVQGFKASVDYTSGKEVVKVKVDFSNKSYTTNYTMSE